ncbi:MAG: glycosyltransferase family 2 protein [Alphaproteobacteria bacterium]|nr:glycosyltransferase family 2 protein [Alphaproteobacteria bacterium]
MEIGVVIPTRNRAAFLGKALMSLCEQTLAPSRYEICVVNNGSTDATPEVVALINAHYPKHRVFMVDEAQTGVAYARNTGMRATTAPLIVQGDDDATASPDWLEKFIAAFAAQGGDVGKIGGDVIPVWGAPRPDWLTDPMLPLLTAASGFGDQPRYMNEGLLECNGCYRREALEQAGLFPTTLGRKGANLLSAEHAVDLVMHMQGWKLYYDPAIVIHHHIHAERLKPVWMRRRYFWQGISDYAVRAYLKSKGYESSHGVAVEMPLDRSFWTFINNADEAPTEDGLNRLRGLGLVLARTGFIPTGA